MRKEKFHVQTQLKWGKDLKANMKERKKERESRYLKMHIRVDFLFASNLFSHPVIRVENMQPKFERIKNLIVREREREVYQNNWISFFSLRVCVCV